MGEVITLEHGTESHVEGEAICEKCKHKWHVVAPVGTDSIECPKCNLFFGELIAPCAPPVGGYVWSCDCGWTSFYLTPDGPMCRQCGTTQEGF